MILKRRVRAGLIFQKQVELPRVGRTGCSIALRGGKIWQRWRNQGIAVSQSLLAQQAQRGW